MANPLRRLPSVDRVLREPPAAALAERTGHETATRAIRRAIDDWRERLRAGEDAPDDLAADIAAAAAAADATHLTRVVNATGVIVHTNLGRAPLAAEAAAAAAALAAGYANLELDLETGARGSRQEAIGPLVSELTGAEAGIAVGNCAAALLLVLASHAAGRDVIVSRGQLVEIGDGFRIPEILIQSGAKLVEVGTTNRTTLRDYERAIGPDTALILRVHPSNYRVVGFTTEVGIEELATLGRDRGVPVVDDIGSGLIRRDPLFPGEPAAAESIAAGATLVTFSGDKLLGGPQAGLIAGGAEAIDRCRRHPLARALRIGKLACAALEATLRLHRDPGLARARIPVLAMAHESVEAVRGRASELAGALGGTLVESEARIGGGALPTVALASYACALDDPAGILAAAIRTGTPPILGRTADGRLLLDARTIAPDELADVVAAVRAAQA